MNRANFLISTMTCLLILMACNTPKNASQTIPNNSTDQANHFEGRIIYDLKMEDKTGEMTKEQMKMFMGDEQIYTIKDNKYKSEMNGMMKMVTTYLGQDTLYTQVSGMNSILWIDASSNPDQLLEYNIQEDAETIAGIKCDLLTIKSEDGINQYWFNKKYSVDPNNFKNHDYGFWKFCIEKTNALPIKNISDTKDMYLEITAKEIKALEIDAAEFILPNLPRMKNPEN